MRRRVRVLVTAMVLAGCAAPADSTLPSTSPSADPSGSPVSTATTSATPIPSAMPSATATPVPTGGASGAELVVPSFVSVTADRLLIRKEPGLTGEPVTDAISCIDNPDPNCARPILIGIETGYVDLYLVDGPIAVDGYEWYLAATDPLAVVGWVAAGDAADAWLVSAPRSCPSQPLALAGVTILATSRLELIDCFGGQTMTFRGWYPELPPGERETNLEDCRAERGWLLCYSGFNILRLEPGPLVGSTDYLEFNVDPAAGVTLPARLQWIEVTGSFDNPAATACGEVFAVLTCRSMFVVSSAVVP